MTDIHAIVSHPGAIESSILEALATSVVVQRRPLSPVTLRTLEGGEGAPVLLLHGRMHAATIWAPLIQALVPSRRVIAVDLPGLGHSSSPPFRSHDPEEAARFFVDPIASLVRELGLERASIVGHSLGGLVALELVLRGHVRPPKLALVSSMGLGPSMSAAARAFYRFGPERIVRLLGTTLFSRLLDTASPRARSSRPAALEAELARILGGKAPPSRAFNTLLPLFGPIYDRSLDLQRIDVETLVVWGEDDPVIPAPVAIAAAASIPRAELVMLPGLGHAPHLEDEGRVVPKLASFLA